MKSGSDRWRFLGIIPQPAATCVNRGVVPKNPRAEAKVPAEAVAEEAVAEAVEIRDTWVVGGPQKGGGWFIGI